MNFGKSEGSMIIQMFGRGVRLKGYGMSLKRSSALDESIKPSKLPKDIKIMETLNIFGIRADYMDQFKAYLEDEGLPSNDSDFLEVTVKTVRKCPKGLKILRQDPTYNFKKSEKVHLKDYIKKINVVLDWYPRIDVTESQKHHRALTVKEMHKLEKRHLQFINWEDVFFAIEQFKNERGWYNIELDATELHDMMNDAPWYTLKVPQETLRFKDFGKDVSTWQEITIALLKLFVDKAYKTCQGKHLSGHQTVEFLKDNDPNFIDEYTVQISRKHDEWNSRILAIAQALKDGTFMDKKQDMAIEGNTSSYNGVVALQLDNHLFNPIFYMNNNYAKNLDKDNNSDNWIHITPVALNDGEKDFILAVKKFFTENDLHGKEVYLLRNVSKKGLGFFETEGFYPDFILWIRDGEKQYLTFIDPKGIQHLKGELSNEKIQLYKRLAEEIAPNLNDPNLSLTSFILSNTPYQEVLYKDQYKCEDFINNHVLFQKDDHNYVEKMIKMIVSA